MAREKTNKIRSTIFTEPELPAKLDFIARTEAVKQNVNISRTDIINIALNDYVTKWEKRNGEISVK
jgi:hypothetical protein